MYLEKNILRDKFGKNPELHKEAKEELAEHQYEERAETPYFKSGKHPRIEEPKKKIREMAKKMTTKELESKTYTHVRCGKCNRFGHHHSECKMGKKQKS